MADELKPCPFCGGRAERIDFGPGSGDNEGGSCISCTGCQSSGPVEYGRKENFVSTWNRRLESATTPAEVMSVQRWDASLDQSGFMERCDTGSYIHVEDYATLARQLAEAKAEAEKWRMAEGRAVSEIQRELHESNSALREATRRLGEVEGLVGKWRELGGNDSLDVYYADGLRACADELEQLTKEPTK